MLQKPAVLVKHFQSQRWIPVKQLMNEVLLL